MTIYKSRKAGEHWSLSTTVQGEGVNKLGYLQVSWDLNIVSENDHLNLLLTNTIFTECTDCFFFSFCLLSDILDKLQERSLGFLSRKSHLRQIISRTQNHGV